MTKQQPKMADNIDSMDSLMTIFKTDLYIIEHCILCLGECYYYDLSTDNIYEGYLTMEADDIGDVELTYIYVDENNNTKTIQNMKPMQIYLYCSKDLYECAIMQENIKETVK